MGEGAADGKLEAWGVRERALGGRGRDGGEAGQGVFERGAFFTMPMGAELGAPTACGAAVGRAGARGESGELAEGEGRRAALVIDLQGRRARAGARQGAAGAALRFSRQARQASKTIGSTERKMMARITSLKFFCTISAPPKR